MPFIWIDDPYEGTCRCDHKEKHVPRGWSCGLSVCEDGWHTVPNEYSTPCPFYPRTFEQAQEDKEEQEANGPLDKATRQYMKDNAQRVLTDLFTPSPLLKLLKRNK